MMAIEKVIVGSYCFFFALVVSMRPNLFSNVDLLSLLSHKRGRVAWAVHRTGDFFLKLGQPSSFGSWASYGPFFESKMYNHWFRIDKRTFRLLHNLIKNDPSVFRRDTKFRKCVPSDTVLAFHCTSPHILGLGLSCLVMLPSAPNHSCSKTILATLPLALPKGFGISITAVCVVVLRMLLVT